MQCRQTIGRVAAKPPAAAATITSSHTSLTRSACPHAQIGDMAASEPLHVTRSIALRECVTAWYRTVAGVPSSNGALQQDQSQTMTFAELFNFLRTLLVQAGLGKLNHACFVYFSSLQVGGPHSNRLVLFTCGQRPVLPPATKRLLRQLSLIFVPSLSW